MLGIISGASLEKAIFSGIVFNMSWEDPYVDRDALKIGPGDVSCTIVSGGCNTLSQLCWNPEKVIGVEQNDAQASLLELKVAGIRELDWKTFSDIFGDFAPQSFPSVYPTLRPHLSDKAKAFWDRRSAQKMMVRGLQRAGKNGLFLKMVRLYCDTILNKEDVRRLFEFDNLDDVRDHYEHKIAPQLYSTMLRLVCEIGKPWFYLAGVHPAQIDAVEADMPMFEYVKIRIRELICNTLPRHNYFLAGAALGTFIDRENVPPYLQEKHWETMQTNIDRLEFHRGWLHEVLDAKPEKSVSKFSLLDIFDWMHDKPQVFDTVLRAVIRAATDDALIVYRSGRVELQPPAYLLPCFPQSDEQKATSAKGLHDDMSGIYMDFKVRSIDRSKVPAAGVTEADYLKQQQDAPVAAGS